MSRIVLTYTDIRQIRKSPFFNEIRSCPQITVTTDLRKGINWYPKNHNGERLFDRMVRDFGEVFEKIDPEWNSTTEVFSETVTVSEYFRQLIAETSDEDKIKYYRGFKRNCAQIVRVINMLEETCVYTGHESYKNRGLSLKASIEKALGGKVIINLVDCSKSAEWYYAGYYTNAGSEANYDIYDVSGWGPDYGDPQTYLDTFLPDYAGYMVKCIGIF